MIHMLIVANRKINLPVTKIIIMYYCTIYITWLTLFSRTVEYGRHYTVPYRPNRTDFDPLTGLAVHVFHRFND